MNPDPPDPSTSPAPDLKIIDLEEVIVANLNQPAGTTIKIATVPPGARVSIQKGHLFIEHVPTPQSGQ